MEKFYCNSICLVSGFFDFLIRRYAGLSTWEFLLRYGDKIFYCFCTCYLLPVTKPPLEVLAVDYIFMRRCPVDGAFGAVFLHLEQRLALRHHALTHLGRHVNAVHHFLAWSVQGNLASLHSPALAVLVHEPRQHLVVETLHALTTSSLGLSRDYINAALNE